MYWNGIQWGLRSRVVHAYGRTVQLWDVDGLPEISEISLCGAAVNHAWAHGENDPVTCKRCLAKMAADAKKVSKT